LQKHKGCDILDLNPGVGVWSSKLHEFLQPRSHILLESAPEHFEDYLKPLVEQPNSTYKLIPGDIAEFATIKRIIEEGHLPHQKRVDPGQPHDPGLNNSLLVTGTIFWDPKLPGKAFDSMSKELLASFTRLAANYDVFHAFGRARMLFWTPSEDIKFVLPRSQVFVGKSSVWQQSCAEVTEIVTGEQLSRCRAKSGREARYMLESTYRALKRAKENGIELPAHRRENIHDFAEDIGKMSGGTGMLSSEECSKYLLDQVLAGKSATGLIADLTLRSWQLDQSMGLRPRLLRPAELRSSGRADYLPRLLDSESGTADASTKPKKKLSEMAGQQRAVALQLEINRRKADHLVDLGEDIHQLECDILGLEEGEEKATKLKKVEEMQKEFDTRFERDVVEATRPSVLSMLDDRTSLRGPVPRLQWDSRPFEPLIMHQDEVWPPADASLVDITPIPPPSGETSFHGDYFRDFVYGLYEQGSRSLPEALENMHHGASDLINMAPSLKDPKKGGRLNMRNLRVRSLTVEHVNDLVKAWLDWPFKDPDANHSGYFRIKGGSKPQGDFDI
jgi:transcription factor 1